MKVLTTDNIETLLGSTVEKKTYTITSSEGLRIKHNYGHTTINICTEDEGVNQISNIVIDNNNIMSYVDNANVELYKGPDYFELRCSSVLSLYITVTQVYNRYAYDDSISNIISVVSEAPESNNTVVPSILNTSNLSDEVDLVITNADFLVNGIIKEYTYNTSVSINTPMSEYEKDVKKYRRLKICLDNRNLSFATFYIFKNMGGTDAEHTISAFSLGIAGNVIYGQYIEFYYDSENTVTLSTWKGALNQIAPNRQTLTTLSDIPMNNQYYLCKLQSNQALSLNRDTFTFLVPNITILVYNSTEKDYIQILMPNSGRYVVDSASITVAPRGYAEINIFHNEALNKDFIKTFVYE